MFAAFADILPPAALTWMAGQPTLQVDVASITNTADQAFTISWACDRQSTFDRDPENGDPAPGIYAAVGGPPDAESAFTQPDAWGVGAGEFADSTWVLQPAACAGVTFRPASLPEVINGGRSSPRRETGVRANGRRPTEPPAPRRIRG